MGMKLNNIKNLFIVEEEAGESKNSEKKAEVKKEKSKSKKSTVDSKVSWKSSASKNVDGTLATDTKGMFSQKIFDSLTTAIFEANLPGEDYLEFIEGLRAMKDLPLEEAIKMKTVFMTLTTKGLTIPKIVESAGHYLSVLKKEKDKFYIALDGQKNRNIVGKKKHITGLEKANKEKADLIKRLTDEIGANNAEIKKVSGEISNVESKIKSTENDFIFTYEKMANQINGNIEKIKQINT